MPWTGNEILGRIASDDSPCELHFDEALRQLLRERIVTSESDPWASNLTSTTRCRLAYTLTLEARQASLARPIPAPAPTTPKPAPITAAPPTRVRPALPSPAVRLELIGRLRQEKVRIEADWQKRFGAGCFQSGPPGFLKALFLKARVQGMIPRFRDALERARGKAAADFERHSDYLLQLHDRDGTIPEQVLDAGVKLDPTHYVALDLDRAEREVREGREGNPANAREILAFLKDCTDDASLDRFRPGTAPAAGPSVPGATSSDPLIGCVFGSYKVVASIGKGGMGAVYQGLDETLDRPVALKILHSRFADNREYQERFLREARNAANATLDHPNITQVYAAGRQGPHLWMAMQLVRGRTLSRLLEERVKLPPPDALSIVRQIAEGLTVAHAARMIHRDIKPDNLMIDESGRVKIMDFGLMRSVDVNKDGLTQDGLFVGTLEYASPEQCQDGPLDARTDLYSLGVVLYELLSGARPYRVRAALDYLSVIPDPRQPPAPLREKNPDLPAALEALVHRLISKRPEDRPASAKDLIAEIDQVLLALESGVPKKVDPPPLRGSALPIVAGSLALAACLAAALWLWSKVEKPPSVKGGTPGGATPDSAVPPAGGNLHARSTLLDTHAPDEKELVGLEQLLGLSRTSLGSRSSYGFDEAVNRLIAFRRENSYSPWLTLFVDAEIDRFQAARKAFQVRPLFDPKEETPIELRNGRKIRGRVVGEESGRLIVETRESGRELIPLSQVAPSTFSQTRGRTLQAIQICSSVGDATGALPLLDGLEAGPRRLLQPLLLDQSIEELLRTGDIAKIAAFRIPAPYRAVAESILKSRLKDLALETNAGALYSHLEEDGALDRLLTTYAATRAGTRAAAEALSRFEKSLPEEEKFELVGAAAWGTWDVDRRDAPGGSIVLDQARSIYGLSTPSPNEQVRLLKKLRGAEKGYRIRWSFGKGSSDAPAFMVVLSLTRWFELEPNRLILYRVDKDGAEEKVTVSGKTEFPERVSGGVLHVIPKAGLVLVYVNDRLLLALPGKEYALAGGLQLGVSGGSLTLESIRVLDCSGD
ncbi:MAG TPA: serine/threonine-protein kinase [Planctomycetota bacterium]|nr:serine/threonine-protein kinase [Planctomycetota bacterium]